MHIISIDEIAKKFGMPKSTAYRIAKNHPTFPAPLHLSTRTFRWVEEDIDAWVARESGKVEGA